MKHHMAQTLANKIVKYDGHIPFYCTSSIIMPFIRTSSSGLSLCSAVEGTVEYMAGKRWMLGVDRVKHISLVEAVPVLVEKERRVNETYRHTSVRAQPCGFLAESVRAISGFRAELANVER